MSSLAVQLDPSRLKHNKKLKKIQWLSMALWKLVANGYPLNDADKLNLQGGLAMLKTEPLPDGPFEFVEERPRLAMDRASNSHADELLFHFSRVWLHPKAGLYFLAQFEDDSARANFEAALRLLGDEGIGADRTNGNGWFSFERMASLDLKPANGKQAMALSLVNPAPTDCQPDDWLEGSAYKLISRGGWIGGTGLRKQRLRMFTEGSVFKSALQGQVVEVSPEHSPHPVYRDGRGFFVSLDG